MQKKIRVTPKKKKIMPAVPKTALFPIVGVGASAGEALKGNLAKAGEFLGDITEKETEAGLEKTRKELEVIKQLADEAGEFAENLIDTVREPLIALDQDLRVVKVSRSFYEFFKVKPEETVGQLIYDLGNKQWDIPKLRELLETILPQKATFDNYEVEHDFLDIGKKTMLLNARQIQRASGKERIILLAIEDITEKKAEQANNLLAAIVEGSGDAIFGKDLAGRILSWNKAAEQMYGYEAKEILGKHISLLSPPEEKDACNRIIEQIKRGEKVSHFETERVRKDGSRVWVSLSISPTRDSSGAINGASIIARDITERKKAEEQLKAMALDLQRKTELLEISNKELEAFSCSVSHDLRAPLRSIDGFCKAFMEDYSANLDEQGRNYLCRVCTACQQMAQLIEDMLMLSRINRSEMRRKQVDLIALAKSIADEFMQNEPQRKVEFVIAPSITANGDGQLLNIMLHNLLENAWKFTGKHPAARIELGVTKKEETTVYFVADDGAGFDMKYADKLFGAFQRLHTTEEFEGTGIGLAIVQRIVSRHGGKVWAQGEVEKGAIFYFTLV
jgi:PAS domain S-box-containing protein